MTGNPVYDDFMIGLAAASMMRFVDLKVPRPDAYPFKEGERSAKGNGQVSTHGFPSQVLQWDTISLASAYRMLSFLADATSATVYLRTRRDRRPNPHWTTYAAVMVMPDLSGPDGAPLGGAVDGYSNFALHFQGMVAQ